MKFKVLDTSDTGYDPKDKNFYYSWDWNILKYSVAENPKKMTFNPLEVEFQKLRKYWLQQVIDKIVERTLLTMLFICICGLIYLLIFGDLNV